MKVLILAPVMGSNGGIQRYTVNLERALRELVGDERVHCLALSTTPQRARNNPVSLGEKCRFLLRAVRAAKWRPDLVICTHVALGPVGRVVAMLRRIPYMIVVHGIESWGPLSKLRQAALHAADRVMVTTAFSQEQLLRRQAVRLQRIVRLPCMLDENLLGAKAPASPRFTFMSSKQPVILTVARMDASERYKGHDVLLRALPNVIAKAPTLMYVLVGDGDDRPRLQALATELGLDQHVRFTGPVSDAELASIYRRSQIFALPARTVVHADNPKGEGFGIVFLEAMAFGKPVIAPNYGAPTEFIRHGETGLLVNPTSPESVEQALLELLEDSDLARKLGETGSALVQRLYSHESFRCRLQEIIGDLGGTAVEAIARPCES